MELLKEGDGFKGTDKAVWEQIYCNIYRNCIRRLIEFFHMVIKTWPSKFLAGYNEGKPCGSNFCYILNPSLMLKPKMYSFMRNVPTVLVPGQHFDRTNSKEKSRRCLCC